jgi:PAS domain-containing protein
MSAQLEVRQSNFKPNPSQEIMAYETNKANPAELILLQNGMILACNKAGGELLGCKPNELTWQPISRLVPQLTDMDLVIDEKVNPYLKFLSIAGHYFEVIGTNGTHFASELFFSLAEEFGRHSLRLTMQPVRAGQAITLRHLRTY